MTPKKPLVSVIIPTYNRAEYIKASIDSVLNQKLPKNYELEVLVIDDGSTDNTGVVVRKIKERVQYFQIQHSGLPAVARNFGLKKATGELVAFQDSDDLWTKNKLINQLPTFDDPEVILSYGNAEIIDSNGKPTGKTILAPEMGKSGYVFEGLLKVNFVSTLTVMARKDGLLRVGGFDESPKLRGVEDYELWLRLSRLGKLAYVDLPLALHRLHNLNISNSINYGFDEHILAVYSATLRQSLSRPERKAVHAAAAQILSLNAKRTAGLAGARFKASSLTHKVLAQL